MVKVNKNLLHEDESPSFERSKGMIITLVSMSYYDGMFRKHLSCLLLSAGGYIFFGLLGCLLSMLALLTPRKKPFVAFYSPFSLLVP